MTASEQAAKLWAGARQAAALLEAVGVERGYVQIGAGLPVEVVLELAKLAGVPATIRVYEANGLEGPQWIALYSVESDWRVHAVSICAQGHRPATPEEIVAAGGDSAQAGGAA